MTRRKRLLSLLLSVLMLCTLLPPRASAAPTLYFTAAAIHVNALRIRGHKGRHRLVRLQVDVPSQPVARRVISKIEQDQSGKRDDKFFHGSALAFSVVEFLISGFVAVLAQNVDVLVHPRAALRAEALHLRDGLGVRVRVSLRG